MHILGKSYAIVLKTKLTIDASRIQRSERIITGAPRVIPGRTELQQSKLINCSYKLIPHFTSLLTRVTNFTNLTPRVLVLLPLAGPPLSARPPASPRLGLCNSQTSLWILMSGACLHDQAALCRQTFTLAANSSFVFFLQYGYFCLLFVEELWYFNM